MQVTRYRFQQSIESVKEENKEWLIDEFKHILESDKDFTRKADYIGLSISHLDSQVDAIDEEIRELQLLKKQLKSAKDVALRVGASVFDEYGIEKLEGSLISSITMSAGSTKEKQTLEILNEDELIKRGYISYILDEEAIIKELQTMEGKYKLLGLAQLKTDQYMTAAKLKVNKRRSKNDTATIPTVDLGDVA